YWELRNLGFGESAARAEAHSRVHQAKWREVATLDRIAREVVEANAQVRSRQQQLSVAEEGVQAAMSSFEKNSERILNAQGLPLETLQSLQALAQARREYLRAVSDYNIAQFQLQRAIGWPQP
ncbi:MAG TPA: TolC family protein, partial [Planctomycetaceae bacterium]|nr:TolC family protein [Planctomycetaceae bacterium]